MKENLKIFFAIILSLFLTTEISAFIRNPKILNRKIFLLKKMFLKIPPFVSSFFTQKISPAPSPVFIPQTSFPTPAPTTFLTTPTFKPILTITKPSPTSKPPSPTPTFKPTPKFFSCPQVSNNFFEKTEVLKTNPKPVNQRDDLTLPPHIPVNAKMDVFYAPVADPDPKIPLLTEIFSPPRRPPFLAGYQSTREIRGNYVAEVEILEVKIIPGEPLRFPPTDYDIGGGLRAMVLYATPNAVTFKITREDDVVYGYTLYFENLCVDKNLIDLYNKLNNQGRKQLPAIREGQVFGFAKDEKLKVAIRDTGTFLDLRQIDPETGLGFWR